MSTVAPINDTHTYVCASVQNSRGSSVHTQSKSQRRRKSFFISAVHYYIISGCRRLQLTSCEGDHVQWRPSLSSSSRAFRRARSRRACMQACASSRARKRGQESVWMLAGLVRGPACRPAKGSGPIHRRTTKSTRSSMCTSRATKRPSHPGAARMKIMQPCYLHLVQGRDSLVWLHTHD